MSNQVFLYWDRKDPAGVMDDWGEFCHWVDTTGAVRRTAPLRRLGDDGRPAPGSRLEADLLATFAAADDWPDAAEAFLAAVLNRPIGADPTLGLEHPEVRTENPSSPYHHGVPRHAIRVTEAVWNGWADADRRRAVCVLRIDDLVTRPRPDPGPDRDRRDTELAAYLRLLSELAPPAGPAVPPPARGRKPSPRPRRR